jgi:hypothetical protein
MQTERSECGYHGTPRKSVQKGYLLYETGCCTTETATKQVPRQEERERERNGVKRSDQGGERQVREEPWMQKELVVAA